MNSHKSLDEILEKNNQRILSAFEVQPRYKPENKSSKECSVQKNQNQVKDIHKEWLMAVNIYQYKKTLTEICNLAGFSAGTGSRIAKDCEKRNLAKILQVKFGRGSPKYPVLLPEAYRILDIQEKKFYGKGAGHEHILFQHLIAEHFSEYKPVVELYRNGKFIDVAIETNELLVCMEVAMTSAHEKENIEKDFSKAKSDFVTVACANEKVLKDVQKIVLQMPEQIKNKTTTYLLSEFLKKKPDELIQKLRQK